MPGRKLSAYQQFMKDNLSAEIKRVGSQTVAFSNLVEKWNNSKKSPKRTTKKSPKRSGRR